MGKEFVFSRLNHCVASCLTAAITASVALYSSGTIAAPPINPETAVIAPGLPLADMHLHSDYTVSPTQTLHRMDQNNVPWGGGGVLTWPQYVEGRRDVWMAYVRDLGARYLAFAGQSELNRVYQLGGAKAMASADDPGIKKFLAELEDDLKAKRIKGVGTYFVNNSNTDDRPAFRRKVRGDAPSLVAIYKLISEYGSVLRIHLEADPESMAQIEKVMSNDRRGIILWNQCGSNTTAEQVRALMARNRNLVCEFSWRFPPVARPEFASRFIFDENGPKEEWLALMEDFPDRFMFGNDSHPDDVYAAASQAVRTHLLPYLKPETARRIAYDNARKLFSLSWAPSTKP